MFWWSLWTAGRNSAGDPDQDFRPFLHDQTHGRRHRPGVGHGVPHRAQAPRPYQRGVAARVHLLPGTAADPQYENLKAELGGVPARLAFCPSHAARYCTFSVKVTGWLKLASLPVTVTL